MGARTSALVNTVRWTPSIGYLPDPWSRSYYPRQMAEMLHGERLVFSGDSNTRNLATHLMRQLRAADPTAIPRVTACNRKLGHGCSDCYASGCQGPIEHGMGAGRWIGLQQTTKNFSAEFTWKPQIYTIDDAIYWSRVCLERTIPSVVFLCKGAHDALFLSERPELATRISNGTLDRRKYHDHVKTSVTALFDALRCLPNHTIIIWSAPLTVQPHKDMALDKVPLDVMNEMLDITRVVSLQHCQKRGFLCVDGMNLTDRGMNGVSAPTADSHGGVHYSDRVWNVQLDLVFNAIRLKRHCRAECRNPPSAGDCRVLSDKYKDDLTLNVTGGFAPTKRVYCEAP